MKNKIAIEIRCHPDSDQFREVKNLILQFAEDHVLSLIFFVGLGVYHLNDKRVESFWQNSSFSSTKMLACSSSCQRQNVEISHESDLFMIAGQIQALQIKSSCHHVLSF